MQLDTDPRYATPTQNCLDALAGAAEVLLEEGWDVNAFRLAILGDGHKVLLPGWYVEFTRSAMIRQPDGSWKTAPVLAGAKQGCLGHAAHTAFGYAVKLRDKCKQNGWVLL